MSPVAERAAVRLAVTGTDTGVGKTAVAAAALAALRARGYRVAGMKPAETGVSRGDPGTDAALLRAAAGGGDPEELVCPVVLPEPLAPLAAGRRAGRTVPLGELDAALESLSRDRDFVLIEGAGGLLVPVTDSLRYDGLFRRWRASLIIVAANRLGVLNHTLLTVEAARAAGLMVSGIVLNHPSSRTGDLAEDTNLALLSELLPDVPVLPFPWLAAPRDLAALAAAAEECGIVSLFDNAGAPRPGGR